MTNEELMVVNKLLVKFYRDDSIKLNTFENIRELYDKYGYEGLKPSQYCPSDEFIYYEPSKGIVSLSVIDFLDCMCDDLVEQI